MEGYLLFSIVAIATISSPGPGVLLTLTNAIRYGFTGAMGGIIGIACGTFIVAGIAATGVGVILATSSIAFTIIKYVGAVYLIYLGIKLWRSPATNMNTIKPENRGINIQFAEGLMIQLTNPKAVFFFISIFPQFVDYSSQQYAAQFMLLVVTYSCLNLIIHCLYAYLAKSARVWLSSEQGGRLVNRTGGGIFVCFGVGLATANK